MDIGSALRYPFSSVAKVMTIVLALSIALVICLALIANSADWTGWVQELQYMAEFPDDWAAAHEEAGADGMQSLAFPAGAGLGLLLMLLVAVFGGFWFSGYSLDVMRAVMAEEEAMPEFRISDNLREGFQLFLACLAYGIVACVAGLVFVIVAGLGGVAALIGLVLMIVFCALLGWAYYVGMARYAVGEGVGALLAVVENIKTARLHWRKGLALTGWSIVLALVYKVASGLVDGLVGGMMAGDIVLDFAIFIVIYFAFNFFQHFSTQHLLAQYAMSIGIAPSLEKNKIT